MEIFLLLGIFLLSSGIVILFKKEISMSSLFLIPDLLSWVVIKKIRHGEPEPVYVLRGVAKIGIGVLVISAGIVFCFYYFIPKSIPY